MIIPVMRRTFGRIHRETPPLAFLQITTARDTSATVAQTSAIPTPFAGSHVLKYSKVPKIWMSDPLAAVKRSASSRMWCDSGFPIALALESDARTNSTFKILDPQAKELPLAQGQARTQTRGWHTLTVDSTAAETKPFKIRVTYTHATALTAGLFLVAIPAPRTSSESGLSFLATPKARPNSNRALSRGCHPFSPLTSRLVDGS